MDKVSLWLWSAAIILITSGLLLIFNNSTTAATVPAHTSQVLGVKTKISGCIENNGLPDRECTPGDIDPEVKEDNIYSTICVFQYTKGVRPPASYTSNLKIKQIQEYGYDDTTPQDYQEDHLIPLELGGHPTSAANLWPQPIKTNPGAKDKDNVENYLKDQVCSGKLTLQDAQLQIATDWVKVHRDLTGLGSLIFKIFGD